MNMKYISQSKNNNQLPSKPCKFCNISWTRGLFCPTIANQHWPAKNFQAYKMWFVATGKALKK